MTYQFAEINGTRIHYERREEGTAPSDFAVVFIHAGIADLSMWDDQMDAFAENYQVIRYDLRGWGKSVRPSGEFSDVADLQALLLHLGVEKAALIGCSFGGKTAIDFALTHPEMVNALVLVGAAVGGFVWQAADYGEKDTAMEAAYDRGERELSAELETQIWFDGPRRNPEEVNRDVRARVYAMVLNLHQLPEPVGSKRMEIEPPAIERLREITAPTLVIVGQEDVADIQTIARLLANELPLAEELAVLPDTAHLPNMERPSAFNKLVLEFLEKAAWRSLIFAILPHPTEAQVWLNTTADGFALPHTTVAGGMWDTEEADVQRPFQRLFGPEVQVLYRTHFQEDKAKKRAESVFVLDNKGAVANGRWVDRQELSSLTLAHPAHRPIIEQYLQEAETGDISSLRPPWARPGWHRQAAAWIETRLAQAGHPMTSPLQPVRQWSLSCVLKANTADGPFYFKTVADLPLFVNEARVVSRLAQLYPRHIIMPLAADQERDWMLLPELTEIVGWGAPVMQRAEFLCQFGRLQVTGVNHISDLLAAGCLDRRLAWLTGQIEPLITAEFIQPYLTAEEQEQLHMRIPHLQAMCGELAEIAVPETLVHGDLHGGNVAMRGSDYIYFDWTDACISHPFFDMLNIFMERDTVVQTQLRDAYLAQWLDFAPMPRLLQAWSLAEVLGAVHHAISYWQIVANIEAHNRHQLEGWMQWWLRRILALVSKLEAQDN